MNNLAVEILDPEFEFLRWAKHEFDEEAFEQPGSDVPVRFVIVLAPFVYFFDLTLFCRKKYGLDIVMDKVGINIPEKIGAGYASNY